MILIYTYWCKVTASANAAEDIAATNASIGNAKGVSVNVGTFRSCKKINEATSNNFDIKILFDEGINDTQSEERNKGDDVKEEDNNIMIQTQDITLLIKDMQWDKNKQK